MGGAESLPGSLGRPPTHAQDLRLLFVPRAVGRKQFMRFEWANHAAEALGCEYEELNTATFKHHLRQIIEQVTGGRSRRHLEEEETSSGTEVLPLWADWVPCGPAPGDTSAVGSLSPARQGLNEGLLYADLLGAGKAVGGSGRGSCCPVLMVKQSALSEGHKGC